MTCEKIDFICICSLKDGEHCGKITLVPFERCANGCIVELGYCCPTLPTDYRARQKIFLYFSTLREIYIGF